MLCPQMFQMLLLHPGTYFLTVIADMDSDGDPSPGDVTHARQKVVVVPNSKPSVTISGINVQN